MQIFYGDPVMFAVTCSAKNLTKYDEEKFISNFIAVTRNNIMDTDVFLIVYQN